MRTTRLILAAAMAMLAAASMAPAVNASVPESTPAPAPLPTPSLAETTGPTPLYTTTLQGGTLTIKGTNESDALTISCQGGFVYIAGDTTTTACTTVTTLVVNGGAGSDNIDLSLATMGAYTNLTSVTLYGGRGYDILTGWEGNETSYGGKDHDTFGGSLGNDVLDGGAGTNSLNTLYDGNQTLTDTSLTGALGNDTLSGITGGVIGGGANGNILDASGFTGYIFLVGLGGTDTLTLGPGGGQATGGAGGDALNGGTGNDRLIGDDSTNVGNDTLNGGGGDDTVEASVPNNVILTNATMTGSGSDTLSSIENASLTARSSGLTMNGAAFSGDIYFTGSDGNDTLTGGPGDDFFNGVNGVDVFTGNAGDDDVLASTSSGTETLTNASMTADGSSATISTIELVRYHSSGDTTLNASAFSGDVAFFSFSGHPVFTGNGAGSLAQASHDGGTAKATDSMLTTSYTTIDLVNVGGVEVYGSMANDVLKAGTFSGPVTFSGQDGKDTAVTGPGADLLIGGGGADNLSSEGGADLLYGEGGPDTLDGGKGQDGCNGGKGTDSFSACEQTAPPLPNTD